MDWGLLVGGGWERYDGMGSGRFGNFERERIESVRGHEGGKAIRMCFSYGDLLLL